MVRSQDIMGLPQLKTCCVIFDLRVGCIIMGTISAVLSFTLVCIMIAVAAGVDYPPGEDIEKLAAATGLYAMSIILVLMFLGKFIFDITFIWGVATERPKVIKVYMITWIVFFLLSMFIFFLNSPDYNAWTICTEIIYISHNVYTILLSNSFYKQLNSREEV